MGKQRPSLAKVISELFWAPVRILSIIHTRQFMIENSVAVQETSMAFLELHIHEDPCGCP